MTFVIEICIKGTDQAGIFMSLKCVIYYANYHSHNFIELFENQIFSDLDNLHTLDMRSNSVTGIDINALHLNIIMYVAFNYTTLASRKSSIAIFVDNEAMCCFITSSVKCRMLKKSPRHVNCGMLIKKRVYVAFFSLYSYFIVLWRDCILFTVTTGTV